MRYWPLVLILAAALSGCGSSASQTAANNNAPIPTEQEARERFQKEKELNEWVRSSSGTWETLPPSGQTAFLDYHQQDANKAHEHFEAIASTTNFGGEQ